MIKVRKKAAAPAANPAAPTGDRGFLPEPAAILRAAPEHEFEPVPGLPEELPDGERILWQGAPSWRVMARRAFLTRTIAIYFGLLMAGRALIGWSDGESALAILSNATALLPLAVVGLGLLAAMAYAIAKTTLYTITTARVVLRIGIALQLTLNVPFKRVANAAVAAYPDGAGEISLALSGKDRFAYLLLWPHARPWRFAKPEPSLRCLADVAEPARILGEALAAAHAAAQEGGVENAPAPAHVEPTDLAPEAPVQDNAPHAPLGGLAAAR